MGYVFAHTFGNIKMYFGPAEIDRYSAGLRKLFEPIVPATWVLWIIRVALIAALALHIHAAYSLAQTSRQATAQYQHKRQYLAANYANRTMRWTGPIVGLFLIWHLFDMSWTGTGYAFHRGDVYRNVVRSIGRWWNAVIYLGANLALGIHMIHGSWSVFQSLGGSTRRTTRSLRWATVAFTAITVAPLLSIPVAVLVGLFRV
jgi:succinate dehydrogenase / fumarate reductase cytochrome b subunit